MIFKSLKEALNVFFSIWSSFLVKFLKDSTHPNTMVSATRSRPQKYLELGHSEIPENNFQMRKRTGQCEKMTITIVNRNITTNKDMCNTDLKFEEKCKLFLLLKCNINVSVSQFSDLNNYLRTRLKRLFIRKKINVFEKLLRKKYFSF